MHESFKSEAIHFLVSLMREDLQFCRSLEQPQQAVPGSAELQGLCTSEHSNQLRGLIMLLAERVVEVFTYRASTSRHVLARCNGRAGGTCRTAKGRISVSRDTTILHLTSMLCGLAAVGQLAAHSALVKGAEKVAIVDSVQYRMDYVKKWLPEVETIDFSKVQVSFSPPHIVSLWMACSVTKACAAPRF